MCFTLKAGWLPATRGSAQSLPSNNSQTRLVLITICRLLSWRGLWAWLTLLSSYGLLVLSLLSWRSLRAWLALGLLIHAITIVVSSISHGLGIVHTYSHSHFIAHIIEALRLTVHSNGSRDGHTICIFLGLDRTLVCCSTLEASTKWPFKRGLETLCQECEERIGRCRVG